MEIEFIPDKNLSKQQNTKDTKKLVSYLVLKMNTVIQVSNQ